MTDITSSTMLSDAGLSSDPAGGKPKRDVFAAMWRGARGKCPSCGKGRLFARYLKVNDQCAHCSEALHHHRADDAPPYFTIFIVGHVIVPLMISVEVALRPELWIHMLVWIPLTTALCMALLPLIKGAVVGLQWALYMHGFDPNDGEFALAAGQA